jgi:hypothetical protein
MCSAWKAKAGEFASVRSGKQTQFDPLGRCREHSKVGAIRVLVPVGLQWERATMSPLADVIGRLPGWELVREQSPSAATAHHVEDRVQDLAERVQPRSADCLGQREERVQASEFSVSEVGQVRSPGGSDTGHPTGKTDPRPGFQTVFSPACCPWACRTPYIYEPCWRPHRGSRRVRHHPRPTGLRFRAEPELTW